MSMLIDEVDQRITITFPRPINRKEAWNLGDYLSRNLLGDVKRNITYGDSLLYDKGRIRRFHEVLRVKFDISRFGEERGFGVLTSNDDLLATPSRISSMKFDRVLDWRLEDYKPEDRKLWDDTREVIERYFDEVLKKK